jgi:predicted HD superfamily hydrolase involved in NAD metabolism
MKLEKMKSILKKLISEKRYIHSIGVMEESVKLAEYYGFNIEKAMIAGLLHDCAKGLNDFEILAISEEKGLKVDEIEKKHPSLLHSKIGAVIARDTFKITDEEVLFSISSHTSGRPGMTELEKIVLVADFIEPGRIFDGVEKARELAYKDLDETLLFTLEETIFEVIKKGQLLHPLTVLTRNWVVERRNENEV